jgi:hypothetical protein
MKQRELLGLGKTILGIMSQYPKARDDDMYLILHVWMALHPSKIFQYEERQCVKLKDIHELFESPESIRRTRQKIQNDLGLFPPTSYQVMKARRMKEENWREAMRNNFNLEQSTAILEIYTRVKGKNKKSIKQIKQEILEKYNKPELWQ